MNGRVILRWAFVSVFFVFFQVCTLHEERVQSTTRSLVVFVSVWLRHVASHENGKTQTFPNHQF